MELPNDPPSFPNVVIMGSYGGGFRGSGKVWPSVNAMAESYRLAQENPELGRAGIRYFLGFSLWGLRV